MEQTAGQTYDKYNKIVSEFASRGYLLDSTLSEIDWDKIKIKDFIEYLEENIDSSIINKQILASFLKFSEKSSKKSKTKLRGNVEIIQSYETAKKKYDLKDWVNYYNSRYEQIRSFLQNRVEMKDVSSIGNLYKSPENQPVSTIGVVKDVRITKKGNYFIVIEDPTGQINCVVNSNNKEEFNKCKEVVYDEVIGVKGKRSGEFIWTDAIIFPDVEIKPMKRSPNEGYALFLSDIHVGSERFQHKSFQKFINWLNGKEGNEHQRKIAEKVKYVFVAGDVVDGIGIYPGHDKELEIKDIFEQYKVLADYLKQIPDDIAIIMAPGNHDAMRLAEPQHIFFRDISAPLFEIPNVFMVSNPGTVRIDASEDFEGFYVLIYHGYSYDYYANEVEAIREKGSYDAVDELMKILIKKRHIAPTHGSTPLVPSEKDNMVIDIVPDIFTSGHIHKSKVGQYKHITLVSASCWQSTTIFQEKLGHHPDPGRVPMMNLKTREITLLNFGNDENE